MCCCGKPVINGELGYRWQPNDTPTVREPNPPDIGASDTLLYDEPGRCGGLDCHSHHYRLVRHYSSIYLYVRHGGGDENFRVSTTPAMLDGLAAMDSTMRYWIFSAIFHAHAEGKKTGQNSTKATWAQAAAERRIKTRKSRGYHSVKVWIEPKNDKTPLVTFSL